MQDTWPEKTETTLALTVPPGYKEDGRIDVYLTRFILNATRAKVQKGIREGQVKVNGTVVNKPSYRVQAGDKIQATVWKRPPQAVVAEDIPLQIIYEDAALLVVNKAAGMVVHPAYGNWTGTLVNALLFHVGGGTITMEEDADEDRPDDATLGLSTKGAYPVPGGDPSIRPGIVHRLDKDTSGLMVVAKDDAVHAHLARQFEHRTVEREYRALVWGVPDPPEGRIESQLGRDPRDRKRMAVVAEGRGKRAITNYRRMTAMAYTSLVAFRLETGRTHQIRVHAQHIGHPVLGDETYGGRTLRYGPDVSKRRAFFKNLFEKMPRQALHAFSLGFIHPRTGVRIYFEAPLPEDMQYVLDTLQRVEGG